jgi:hypothetical protein
LIAGVYTLSELPEKLRDRVMHMPKVGKGCTYKDAEVLATYAKLRPDPTGEDKRYNRFIEQVMAT